MHGRHKAVCKECGGKKICVHGRQKAVCKDCGGVQIIYVLTTRERCVARIVEGKDYVNKIITKLKSFV